MSSSVPEPVAPSVRRALDRFVLTPILAIAGAAIGLALVPATTASVGPLEVSVALRPSLSSEMVLLVPPVGQIVFDSHQAPVRIEGQVEGVDIAQAQALIADPSGLSRLEQEAPDAITRAAEISAALNIAFAAIGAGLGVGLATRRWRRTLISAASIAALTGSCAGLAAATFRPESLQQPRFEGLLSQAAYLADVGESTAANYASYRATFAEFVGQVSALYVAADGLPVAQNREDLITVLHVSDLHDNPQAFDVIRQLDRQFDIDVVVDTGDIVSWGTGIEHGLLSQIGTIDSPYVYIQGNHDGAATAAAVAANPNAIVLDNETAEVAGLTFAGIGDPRFAADDDSDAAGFSAGKEAVAGSGFQLGETITSWDAAHPEAAVDIALQHDPSQKAGLLGRAPLVLSGHMHSSKVELDVDGSGTDWLTVGSTGGALASGGVRPVLDGGEPLDLTARLLYFDRTTQRLVAYDDIVMGGLGLVSISIQRQQLPARPEEPELTIPSGAETPEASIPPEQVVEPGVGLSDEERLSPAGTSQ